MTIIKPLINPTPTQLDQVMAIWLHGNLDAHPFVDPAYWHDQVPAVRTALPAAQLLVATADHQISGFIGLQETYIAGIFVAASARHQGIGTALLTAAKAQHSELTLSVYAANEAAVTFYQHHGFHVREQGLDPETQQAEYTMHWHR